jgi:hypothetical protein
MAVEVAGGQFLFVNETGGEEQTLTLPLADITTGRTPLHTESESQPLPLSRSSTFQAIPFRYDILHDLESIWWITAWFLLLRPVSSPSMGAEEEETFAQLADHYFSGTSTHRRYLLTSGHE